MDPAELMAGGQFVQAGRLHESRHRIPDAVDAYVRGGAWAEAARLLAYEGKFAEAARVLLRSLPDRPTPVVRLSHSQRQEALNAALLFAKGGARREAVGLLMNLGQNQRAAVLLQMAGLRQDAVRAMRGEPIEGSPWPQGVLNSLDAEPEAAEEPPSWSPRSTGQVASQSGAPWEGSRSEPTTPKAQTASDRRAPSGTPPTPPWKRRPLPPESAPPPLRGSTSEQPLDLGGPAAPADFTGSASYPRTGQQHLPSAPRATARGHSGSHSAVPASRAPSTSGRLLRAAPGSLLQQELASYMATSPQDRSYGLAVHKVVELVWEVELLPPRVTQFLDDYLRRQGSGADASSWPTLYALARLFEFHDRMEGARAAYRALLASNPTFADAAGRLDRLEEGMAEASDGSWQPVHLLIDGLHGFASLPPLEQIPGFDGLVGELPPPGQTGQRRRLVPPEAMEVQDQTGSGQFTSPNRGASAQPGTDETMDFDDYMGTQSAPLPGGRRGRRTSESDGWVGGSEPGGIDDQGGLTPGVVIASRYRIESEIGSGGMATVYRATDLELEEVVAIKVFQQVVQNRAGLDRFRREMKLSRKLVHPNIVRIYEFGTWRGARFITMELLRGLDLEGWMAQFDGPCPHEDSLRLLMQACEGLAAAHAAKVVHRDVKPQNLFVVQENSKLKVMDFGIAKVNDSAASISVTGVRVGTPRYMSPEQIQGDTEVGPAADLYALGGVAYEMFTGTPVFEEEELVPLLLSHMTEEPEPPTSRNPTVPPVVEQIILKLLSKKPEDRYADCAELKKAFLQAYVATQRA